MLKTASRIGRCEIGMDNGKVHAVTGMGFLLFAKKEERCLRVNNVPKKEEIA